MLIFFYFHLFINIIYFVICNNAMLQNGIGYLLPGKVFSVWRYVNLAETATTCGANCIYLSRDL